MPDARRYADATQRNRVPILEVLARYVKPGDGVLELASGSGEHALFLAANLPVSTWQPTDPDPEARASIAAWIAWEAAHGAAPTNAAATAASVASTVPSGLSKVSPPLPLDVRERPWPVETADVVVAINVIHISPWEVTEALFAGAAELSPRVVYLYGPYRRDGAHTAPSNAAFDQWLQARDYRWGVRDLDAVVAIAETSGFTLREVVEMPANNLSVVFEAAGH